MALLPLDQFLCWKLKIATIATAFWVVITAFFAGIMEVLDIAAQADRDFDIVGGFKAHWRSHVWEGWLACCIVMVVCHLIIIAYSILIVFAVKRFPTYYEFNLTKGYLALLIMYILVELGTSLYKYSWYGPNTFRLAYLVFTFLYWVVRTLLNVTGCVIVHSRIMELEYEIYYGEKKILNPYMALQQEAASGYTTPARPGTRTPRPY